jgi:hypothetical protein
MAAEGNLILPVPKTPKLPTAEKIKEKNYVDRYLTWMDGEAKKLKSFMFLPTIYQIFPKRFADSISHLRVQRNAFLWLENCS